MKQENKLALLQMEYSKWTHQDNMLWGRTALLLGVQLAVLGGERTLFVKHGLA
ncbi:MAG: hypothetical protein ABID54_04370 [Pseudomonadota bacterium]